MLIVVQRRTDFSAGYLQEYSGRGGVILMSVSARMNNE